MTQQRTTGPDPEALEPDDADVQGAWTGQQAGPDADADIDEAPTMDGPPVVVRVVYDARAREEALAVADAADALGYTTERIDWLDFREDGDGALTRFAPTSTVVHDVWSHAAAARLRDAVTPGYALVEEPIRVPGVEWHLPGVTVLVAPPD
jgi:hypothetical protein